MTSLIDIYGNNYYIPVYLLNPPKKYHVDEAAKVVKQVSESGDQIKIEMRHVYQQEKLPVKIAAGSQTSVLKAQYLKKFPQYKTARMFLGGKELLDTDILQNCIIYKEMVVQVFAK